MNIFIIVQQNGELMLQKITVLPHHTSLFTSGGLGACVVAVVFVCVVRGCCFNVLLLLLLSVTTEKAFCGN